MKPNRVDFQGKKEKRSRPAGLNLKHLKKYNTDQLRMCFMTNQGTVKVRLQAETTVEPRRRGLTELLALEVFRESMRSAPDSG
ncbi:hypothetical protein DVH24_036286 [Malus domestica]|uniref:Uncharacterized protein n=1 Tax=Malus domestica TaxID=3750 RepID=A0A498IIJ2_MALDO|nr:hypothetical protein DVH24_036286 [Malus domestica]